MIFYELNSKTVSTQLPSNFAFTFSIQALVVMVITLPESYYYNKLVLSTHS